VADPGHGRIELMEAVDNQDLETLQKHFPL
jgi:hypothetical protein